MNKQQLMVILWPAFLIAGVLEILVFAMVDPGEIRGFDGDRIQMSRQAVYTLAFLVFWGVVSAACALTALLSRGAQEVNESV